MLKLTMTQRFLLVVAYLFYSCQPYYLMQMPRVNLVGHSSIPYKKLKDLPQTIVIFVPSLSGDADEIDRLKEVLSKNFPEVEDDAILISVNPKKKAEEIFSDVLYLLPLVGQAYKDFSAKYFKRIPMHIIYAPDQAALARSIEDDQFFQYKFNIKSSFIEADIVKHKVNWKAKRPL